MAFPFVQRQRSQQTAAGRGWGARLAQPVFGLSGSLPLKAPGSPGTGQRPQPLPTGCDTAVTSPATRSRETPISFCSQGSRVSAFCIRAVGAGAMPWAISPGSTPGVLGTTESHLPAATLFHSGSHSCSSASCPPPSSCTDAFILAISVPQRDMEDGEGFVSKS